MFPDYTIHEVKHSRHIFTHPSNYFIHKSPITGTSFKRHDGVWRNRQLGCLFNYLIMLTKKALKLRIADSLWGEPPATGGFPSQRAGDVETVSMSWHSQTETREWIKLGKYLKMNIATKNQDHASKYIDGLVQDCDNSSANPLESPQSCAQPSDNLYGTESSPKWRFTHSTMHQPHIPQRTIQNRNVHTSVLHGVLWEYGTGALWDLWAWSIRVDVWAVPP